MRSRDCPLNLNGCLFLQEVLEAPGDEDCGCYGEYFNMVDTVLSKVQSSEKMKKAWLPGSEAPSSTVSRST